MCPPTRRYASTCFFPTSWLAVPLISATTYNHDTKIFEFGLPAGRSLDLPVCACLLLGGGAVCLQVLRALGERPTGESLGAPLPQPVPGEGPRAAALPITRNGTTRGPLPVKVGVRAW